MSSWPAGGSGLATVFCLGYGATSGRNRGTASSWLTSLKDFLACQPPKFDVKGSRLKKQTQLWGKQCPQPDTANEAVAHVVTDAHVERTPTNSRRYKAPENKTKQKHQANLTDHYDGPASYELGLWSTKHESKRHWNHLPKPNARKQGEAVAEWAE